MSAEYIPPSEAAALLLAYLEDRGAIVTLDDENLFHVDLDPVKSIDTYKKADAMSHAIFSLRDEIRHILIARRVTH